MSSGLLYFPSVFRLTIFNKKHQIQVSKSTFWELEDKVFGN